MSPSSAGKVTLLLFSLVLSLALACHLGGEARACLPEAETPVWLRSNPPVDVLWMDNGEFITLGRLGCLERLRRSSARGVAPPEDAGRWMRYSADGTLLAQLPAGVHWWVHYWPKYDDVVRQWKARGAGPSEYRGLIIFEYGDANRAALYNYDGAALPLDSSLEDLAPRYQHFSGEELAARE